MRYVSGDTTKYLYFVAVDATDFTSRETGLSSFTVYRSRNGAAAAAMTTPTINEVDSSNMPGVYELLLDEDMTIGSGNDSEAMVFHITHAGMAPVTREIELYRPKITAGETLTVSSGAGSGNVTHWSGTAVATPDTAGYPKVTIKSGTGTGELDIASGKLAYNSAWDAEIQSEVQDAIEANHLDHLLAATYDPASKPGAADALLNELIENDGGVSRFTENALEQGPVSGDTDVSVSAYAIKASSETSTIRVEFSKFGALVNADTSVKLSDSTATYGVRRTDTDEVIVADDTAMTNSATGIYEYTFTEPEGGLTYEFAIEIVHDGATIRASGTTVGSPAAGDAPAIINFPSLRLYQDAVAHLVDFAGGVAQDRNLRLIKSAISAAVNEVAQSNQWAYYFRHGRIALNPAYSTGTVAYDHTGGASERLLTLSDGTWPSWAQYSHIKIGDAVYKVDRRLGNTTLTLDAVHNPGADVTAGTSYTLYRNQYQLPANFRAMALPEGDNGYQNTYWVRPEWLMSLEKHSGSAGTPYRVSVIADPDRLGGFVLWMEPYPTSAENFDFIYQADIWPLRRTGFETASNAGTVAVSAGSSSVTGTSTSFSSDMIGAFMRFTTSGSELPTPLEGDNPYVEQHRILSVESTTALTLETQVNNAYSGDKYVISDPIDMDKTLFNYMLRTAERQLAILLGREDASRFYQECKIAQTWAMEWDTKIIEQMDAGIVPYWLGSNYTVDLSS